MFIFNFSGSMLISGDTIMSYCGEEDSRYDETLTVYEYMRLSDEDKKNWAIVDLDDIDNFDEVEIDPENCSIERQPEMIE